MSVQGQITICGTIVDKKQSTSYTTKPWVQLTVETKKTRVNVKSFCCFREGNRIFKTAKEGALVFVKGSLRGRSSHFIEADDIRFIEAGE